MKTKRLSNKGRMAYERLRGAEEVIEVLRKHFRAETTKFGVRSAQSWDAYKLLETAEATTKLDNEIWRAERAKCD